MLILDPLPYPTYSHSDFFLVFSWFLFSASHLSPKPLNNDHRLERKRTGLNCHFTAEPRLRFLFYFLLFNGFDTTTPSYPSYLAGNILPPDGPPKCPFFFTVIYPARDAEVCLTLGVSWTLEEGSGERTKEK